MSTDELARELRVTDEGRAKARARVAQWAPDRPDEEAAVEKRGKSTA